MFSHSYMKPTWNPTKVKTDSCRPSSNLGSCCNREIHSIPGSQQRSNSVLGSWNIIPSLFISPLRSDGNSLSDLCCHLLSSCGTVDQSLFLVPLVDSFVNTIYICWITFCIDASAKFFGQPRIVMPLEFSWAVYNYSVVFCCLAMFVCILPSILTCRSWNENSSWEFVSFSHNNNNNV